MCHEHPLRIEALSSLSQRELNELDKGSTGEINREIEIKGDLSR